DVVCVEFYFEKNKAKSKKIDLALNQSADLVIRVAGLEKPGLLVLSNTDAVGITSGKNDAFVATQSPDEWFLRLPVTTSTSRAVVVAKRLSEDASVHLRVLSENTTLYEADAYVRTFSRTKAQLVVKVKPEKIPALSVSHVVFSITDSLFNEPVSDADVSIGGQSAVMDKLGIYSADLQPDSLAPVPFEVTKEGFKKQTGSIAVDAPDELFEIDPSSATLTVDAQEDVTSPLRLTGVLSDTLSVSLSLKLSKKPVLSDIRLSASTLTLKGRQAQSVELLGSLRDDLARLAKKASVLDEDIRGFITVSGRTRGFSFEKQVPVIVHAKVQQEGIDDVWQLSA
ncbi:MAG TPA: hypothetical protein VI874_00085, partial [Candidatus Norongarragalinales archaeon]|nr:hypothetical protein [Candidatus Norongarragalinales archaeon]